MKDQVADMWKTFQQCLFEYKIGVTGPVQTWCEYQITGGELNTGVNGVKCFLQSDHMGHLCGWSGMTVSTLLFSYLLMMSP